MNRIRRFHPIRRVTGALAVLAAALLASTAMVPAAFALPIPPVGGGTVLPPLMVRTVVVGGMPGWQIALIAAEAAIFAACSAVALDWPRKARRHLIAPGS
jgi:hypothetical protein